MRAAQVALVALACLPLAVAESPSAEIAFRPPGSYAGTLGIGNGTWVALFFAGEAEGSFQIGSERPIVVVEHAHPTVNAGVDGQVNLTNIAPPRPIESSMQGPPQMLISFAGSSGVLFVNADSLRFSSEAGDGQLLALDDSQVTDPVPAELFDGNPWWAGHHGLPQTAAAATVAPAKGGARSFTLEAAGVQSVVWFGAHIDCQGASSCPSGGGWQGQDPDVPRGRLSAGTYSYEEATLSNGTLAGRGALRFAMVAGQEPNFLVNGSMRLPLARVPAACPECIAPDGQTFLAEGALSLNGVAIQPDGTLSAHLEGDIVSARFDEAAVDPASLFGLVTIAAGATAAVGLGILSKMLLGSLFTKLRPDRAIRHPIRRQIHDYIREHPGCSQREIRRATGLARSTIKHHLRVLAGSGHVIEQAHGAYTRIFPATTLPQDRTRVALLREKTLAQLYDVVAHHPWLAQNDIMDLADRQLGWSRSTTQHRLGRLVKAGLVAVRQEGRFKRHAVSDAPVSFQSVAVQATLPTR